MNAFFYNRQEISPSTCVRVCVRIACVGMHMSEGGGKQLMVVFWMEATVPHSTSLYSQHTSAEKQGSPGEEVQKPLEEEVCKG